MNRDEVGALNIATCLDAKNKPDILKREKVDGALMMGMDMVTNQDVLRCREVAEDTIMNQIFRSTRRGRRPTQG